MTDARLAPSAHGRAGGSSCSVAGAAAAVAPTSGLLAACVRAAGSRSVSGALTLAAPDHPVLWPIAAGNEPIADNLTPERNATLRLYNYADYIAPAAIKAFEKKYAQYNVNVTVSTFNDTDEAITKIRTGAVPYDIYFPSYDQISRLVAAELVRPLNHNYLTNIDNVWAAFQNPWYDQRWRYTVPYTVYTTGIGWRIDKVQHRHRRAGESVRHAVGREVPRRDRRHRRLAHRDGDVPAARRQDRHQHRVGRRSAGDRKPARRAAAHAPQPKVTITMYNDLPGGQLGQCQMWSGDVDQRAVLPAQGHVRSRRACATGSRRTATAWSTTT